MKKRILCLFVLVLACVFAAPASGEGIRYEGLGFDTPEEALTCYVEGIKELDFEKILSAFAWETQASHYSVKKQIERAQEIQQMSSCQPIAGRTQWRHQRRGNSNAGDDISLVVCAKGNDTGRTAAEGDEHIVERGRCACQQLRLSLTQ